MNNILQYLERTTLKQEVYDAINYKKDKKLRSILNKNFFDEHEYNHFLATVFHNLKDDSMLDSFSSIILKKIQNIEAFCIDSALFTPIGLSKIQKKSLDFTNVNHINIAVGLAKNEILEKDIFLDLIDSPCATKILTEILIKNINNNDFIVSDDIIEKLLMKTHIEDCLDKISQLDKNMSIPYNSILKNILEKNFYFNIPEHTETKNIKILFDNFIILGGLSISKNKIKNSMNKL